MPPDDSFTGGIVVDINGLYIESYRVVYIT